MVTKDARRQSGRRRHQTRRGRPRVHSEPWTKVSLALFDRQIVRLNRLLNDIRHTTSKMVNRTAVIRALIDGLFDSELEVNTVGSEGELRDRIGQHLRNKLRS